MANRKFTWHRGHTPAMDGRRAAAWCGSGVGAGPDPAEAPLVSASFVLAHAAPYARVLPALHSPLQAAVDHRAPAAHALGFFDLEQRWAGVADRKEQFRIHLTAGGVVAPVHAVHSSITAGLTARYPLGPRACELFHELGYMLGTANGPGDYIFQLDHEPQPPALGSWPRPAPGINPVTRRQRAGCARPT